MSKALLVGVLVALFALASVAAFAADKPSAENEWTVIAQAGGSSGYGGSGQGTMHNQGNTSGQSSQGRMGKSSHQTSQSRSSMSKAGRSTGAKSGAGPSYQTSDRYGQSQRMNQSKYTQSQRMSQSSRYGAGPRRYHRMPRAGMDLGWVSLAGAGMTLAGFALRRRRR